MKICEVLQFLVVTLASTVARGLHHDSKSAQRNLRTGKREEEIIHLTMLSDRHTGAAAAIESVCRHAGEPSRLRFHIIGPEGGNDWNIQDLAPSCAESGAQLLVYGLEEMTTRVEKAGFSPVWKWPEVSQSSAHFSVRPAEWDNSETHRHPFNLMRFYLPHIEPFKDLSTVIFLDDDILIFGDIAKAWDETLGPGMVMTASCQNWVWSSCSGFESSHELNYLQVPYFGFGRITENRSLSDAACKYAHDRECLPTNFFGLLENASIAINGGQDIITPQAFQNAKAWNYGFNKFDLNVWRSLRVTEKFLAWSKVNFHYNIFPLTSVSFGLGLAMLVKMGHVQCFDDTTPVLQGLGFVSMEDMKNAKLDPTQAFGIHYNGPYKPWCDNVVNPYATLFMDYAQSSWRENFQRTAMARKEAREDRERNKFTSFELLTDPRSGSEWFMDTLDRHPEICASGEADESAVGFPAESLIPGRLPSVAKELKQYFQDSFASPFQDPSAPSNDTKFLQDNVKPITSCHSVKSSCAWGTIAPVVWNAANSTVCNGDTSAEASALGIPELPVSCSLLLIARQQLAGRGVMSPTRVQLAEEAFQVHMRALMRSSLHAHDVNNTEFLLPCRCGRTAVVTGTKVMHHWIGYVNTEFVQDTPWGTNYNLPSNGLELPTYDLLGAMEELQSRVVLYTRKNLLARHVSLLAASHNDIYHCTDQECVEKASNIKVKVDVTKFRNFVRDHRAHHERNMVQLEKRKIPYIELFYEDCEKDMKKCFDQVTSFLEVSNAPDELFQETAGIYLKNEGALSTKISNVAEVSAALREDGESWLDE